MGLADLQIHTIYSYDGTASIPAVLARAKEVGLNVIAITDHDEIKGALQAFELAQDFGVEVIPGIEITTMEIIALTLLALGFIIVVSIDTLQKRRTFLAQDK